MEGGRKGAERRNIDLAREVVSGRDRCVGDPCNFVAGRDVSLVGCGASAGGHFTKGLGDWTHRVRHGSWGGNDLGGRSEESVVFVCVWSLPRVKKNENLF